jgi:DNA-binding NarL/FixJ family response regulator
MVASRLSSRFVPIDLLIGASCLLTSRVAAPDPVAVLTPAEARVHALIVAGLSNKEIASALNRAEPTIKHQVSAILRKTGQPSRARLIAQVRG